MADFIINSLRGGICEDPPTSIADDQCVEALNVEFHLSTLGDRRQGCAAIDTTGWPFDGYNRVVWLHRHVPTGDPSDAQLWALGILDSGPTATLAFKDTTWHTITMPDPIDIDGESEYQINGQSLHGKLFLSYPSAGVDRLHVYDPDFSTSALRRVGIAEPSAPPTGADSGVGSISTLRYYRVRWTFVVSGETMLRSEPTDALTFVPSGSGAAVVVTRPSSLGADSHINAWQLEASTDGVNFYVLDDQIALGSTYSDGLDLTTTTYAENYELAEDIGDYSLIPSVKFLSVDQDRLIGASSFEDDLLTSRVIWTPVFKDPGVGNDERIPLDTDNFLDLDVSDGGPITGMSAAINGYVFVTKFSHIYQFTRTGVRTAAYEAIPITKQRGALNGSIVEALDQEGNPTLFCLDPSVGPARIGPRGFEPCGRDIKETWSHTVLGAGISSTRGLYYPRKKQVFWWLDVVPSGSPNQMLVLHTEEMRETPDGMRRGWVFWSGVVSKAISACLFATNIDDGVGRSNDLRPFIALEDFGLIGEMDRGSQDMGLDYPTRLTTKPYLHGSLLNQFEVQRAVLLARKSAGVNVKVTIMGNFGEFVKDVEVSLDTLDTYYLNGAGDPIVRVMRTLDNLGLSELRAVQIRFSDPDNTEQPLPWYLELFAMQEERWQRA